MTSLHATSQPETKEDMYLKKQFTIINSLYQRDIGDL